MTAGVGCRCGEGNDAIIWLNLNVSKGIWGFIE
jgi:hypothetical protein